MARGGARPGAGPKPLPAGKHRVPVAVRLPPASAALLRALADLTGESQADVLVAALERYDAYVRRVPRKPPRPMTVREAQLHGDHAVIREAELNALRGG